MRKEIQEDMEQRFASINQHQMRHIFYGYRS
jgi:hypothetical protein